MVTKIDGDDGIEQEVEEDDDKDPEVVDQQSLELVRAVDPAPRAGRSVCRDREVSKRRAACDERLKHAQKGTPSLPMREIGPTEARIPMMIHSMRRVTMSHRVAGVIRKTRIRRRLRQMTRDEKALPRSPIWMRMLCVLHSLVGYAAVGISPRATHCAA